MTVKEFAQKAGFSILAGSKGENREITGVYACDLLSWVMAHAQAGNAWITIHTHVNIIAVAVLNELSCIIIPENAVVDNTTAVKADQEGIVLLGTGMSTYEICCRACSILNDDQCS